MARRYMSLLVATVKYGIGQNKDCGSWTRRLMDSCFVDSSFVDSFS